MISLTHERHVFRIDVGDLRRNGFVIRRASVGFMILACDIGVNGHLQAVFCASGTKERLPPHHRSRVIARGISDKGINIVHQQHTPPARASCYSCACLGCLSPSLVRMASDTLIPDTRVLAIASHVGFTGAKLRYLKLTCDR
jgi:hypothetical protein